MYFYSSTSMNQVINETAPVCGCYPIELASNLSKVLTVYSDKCSGNWQCLKITYVFP